MKYSRYRASMILNDNFLLVHAVSTRINGYCVVLATYLEWSHYLVFDFFEAESGRLMFEFAMDLVFLFFA